MKLINYIFAVFVVAVIFGHNIAVHCTDCKIEYGCLLKKKFYGFISSATTMGVGLPKTSEVNFKNIYVFTDRIVFYKAKLPQENEDETEIIGLNKLMDESNILRSISFQHIILECGKLFQSLCHAKNFPHILHSKPFNTIKSIINNAAEKCLAFTFLDEAFTDASDKIAIICIKDKLQMLDLLNFKGFVSKAIESYQLQSAISRFESSNGIAHLTNHFISYINNKPVNVVATFFGKGILLSSDDKDARFLNFISYYNLRNTGAYRLRKATEMKKLKDGWAEKMRASPPEDCCIVMPGKDRLIINFRQ